MARGIIDQAERGAAGEAVAAPAWDWLLRLPVLPLRFHLEPARPFAPPPFPGSMFRGALGYALKDAACVRDHRDCARCDLVEACAYPQVFEPARSRSAEGGPSRRPPPFVLEWESGLGARDPSGSAYPLDVLLLGRGAVWAPVVVPAMARAAAGGLGTRRVPHRLASVTTVAADGVERPGLVAAGPLGARLPTIPSGDRLTVRFITPLRLRDKGLLADRVHFEPLVRAALRRARLLASGAGIAAPWINEGFLAAAAEVRAVRTDLGWFDWKRRSERQGVEMALGGVVGEVVFEGPVAPYATLLAAASVLHVGKQASFGLGRVAVEGGA
ncbi:MAG: CRISPR system precrRNA processing endoribonuclease RAMP protein Cas6 [Planctomycetes bacterium]|nr:CRISPR system precrRNA processing endoribonuclease RAMP protein Cas6 [Planctomycetota bacterium]